MNELWTLVIRLTVLNILYGFLTKWVFQKGKIQIKIIIMTKTLQGRGLDAFGDDLFFFNAHIREQFFGWGPAIVSAVAVNNSDESNCNYNKRTYKNVGPSSHKKIPGYAPGASNTISRHVKRTELSGTKRTTGSGERGNHIKSNTMHRVTSRVNTIFRNLLLLCASSGGDKQIK